MKPFKEYIREKGAKKRIIFKQKTVNIIPIRTEADYKLALKRLEEIFNDPIDTVQSDEADIPGLMIDEYEKKTLSD